MTGDPGLWVVLAGIVVAVLVLRLVIALAIRLAIVGALILGGLWLWRSGALDGLTSFAG